MHDKPELHLSNPTDDIYPNNSLKALLPLPATFRSTPLIAFSNDFVLGQIDADDGKTVSRKRIDNIESGILPDQPVNDIIQVIGSESGQNFIEKSTDSLGRITGNFELVRDTGVFSGSPWGFDKLHFIDDRIRDFPEDLTKGRFNGQDPVTFSDILEVGFNFGI